VTKTFTLFTVTAFGLAGPHPHPKYLDNARLWQLAKHINRAPRKDASA
jgi:hypothetical protein